MRCDSYVAAVFLLLCGANSAFCQAFVEDVSPPVVQRGMVTRLQFMGTETEGPLALWTSLPSETVRVRRVESAGQATSALDVELSNAAPIGLFGLRLATRSGLSNLHLFLVDELPVTRRVETPAGPLASQTTTGGNADPPEPMPIKIPACVMSACLPAEVDRYAITVEKGQRVGFEVVGNRFGKDYDPLVQIRNSVGKLIAECDNSVGLFFDCRFAHTFAEAGTYMVEVRDARFEGESKWHYVLRMGDFPEARVAVPSAVRIGETTSVSFPQTAGWQLPITVANGTASHDFLQEIRQSPGSAAAWITLTTTDLPVSMESEPNDTLETATPVAVPASLNGVLNRPGDRDWFAFELAKDQKFVFQGVAAAIGSAADLELILFDADGREVRRVDDTDLDEGQFAFNVGKPGMHRLMVRDLARDGGPAFAYRIDVRAGGPQFQLLAEAPDLTIPQGTFQPLPLKVTRTEFTGEIRLELRGAPTGMTLEPSVIPADATEFVGRVIAAPTTPEGIYSLQVVGTASIENGPTLQAIAKTKPLVDRQRRNVDLIPYALRADQRQLPPSLTDQIALMVTPPSPFDVDLPEPVVQLTRFQTADFSIVTTRQPGFVPPITFAVKGGQIGDEQQEREQVYARFTPATPERLTTSGTFFNRINTQLNKHRVDLTASADVDGHRVNLVRTFTLDIKSAFQPTFEPAQPTAEPGGSVRVKILANRVPTFDGPVTMTLGPQFGFACPETIEIPGGQPSTEVEIKVDPKLNPGRHGLRVQAAGFVGKYEESFNLPNFQIEVKKPTP